MTTRRRFLTISAAAFALPTLGQAREVYTWQGVALGARATLRLAHPDAALISARVADEISRLEDIFSLFRSKSALSRLNRIGVLRAPPFELLECLSLAGAVHRTSDGRFDPSVQPLWLLYADGFGVVDEAALRKVQALTGWDKVQFDASGIEMQPGMALTLNGIAQGYIADRVAMMLRAEGLDNILIDTGELRALGGHPDGHGWPVKLAAGGAVALDTRALATSAPLGTTFDAASQVGHILDPRDGRVAPAAWREISVSAPSAALADALSTAACLFADRAEMAACVAGFGGAQVEAATAA